LWINAITYERTLKHIAFRRWSIVAIPSIGVIYL